MFQQGGGGSSSRLMWFLIGTIALLLHHHVTKYAAFAFTSSSSSGNSARCAAQPAAFCFLETATTTSSSRQYWSSSSLSFYRSQVMDDQPKGELNYISTSLEQSNTTIMDLEDQPEKQQNRRYPKESSSKLSSLESVKLRLLGEDDDREGRADDRMMLAVQDMEEEMDLASTTQHVTEEVNQKYNEIFSHIQELDDLIGYSMLPLEMEITKQRQRQKKASTRQSAEDDTAIITTSDVRPPLLKHEAANKKSSKEAAATMEQTITSSSSKEATRLLETEAKDDDDEAVRVRLKKQELCRRHMLAARLDYDRTAAAFVRQKQVVEKESLIKKEKETARRKMLEARLQYEKKKKVAVVEAIQEAQEDEKEVGEEITVDEEEEEATLLKAVEVATEMVSPKDLEEAEHISKEQIDAANEEDSKIKIQQELCRRSMLESRLKSERAATAAKYANRGIVVTQSKAEEAEAISTAGKPKTTLDFTRVEALDKFARIKRQQESAMRKQFAIRREAQLDFARFIANEVGNRKSSFRQKEEIEQRPSLTTKAAGAVEDGVTPESPKSAVVISAKVDSISEAVDLGTSRTDTSTAAILAPEDLTSTNENMDVKETEKELEMVEIVSEQLHKKQDEIPPNRIDTSVVSTSSPVVTFTTTEKMENNSHKKINQTVEVNAAEPLHKDKKQEDEISSKQVVPKKRPQPVKLQCNEMRSGGFGLRRW